MADIDSKLKEIRREAFDEIFESVAELEIQNWKTYHGQSEFAMGKDRAYREVTRILTDELNKYEHVKY